MLKLSGISAGYDGKTILDCIHAEFFQGNIYALIGKNGCGKSTLLKVCADVLKVNCGDIILNGKNLRKYSLMERARTISYLPQHRNTPNITVERLIMHGRHPYMGGLKQPNETDLLKVRQAMEVMNVECFKNQALTSLSGGERQRVYIAMVLAQDTPVILLDEPTIYMDIRQQLSFLEYLHEIKAADKLIIAVLHDINQALCTADAAFILDNGKAVALGKPDEIVNSNVLENVFGVKVTAYNDGGRRFYEMRLKD